MVNMVELSDFRVLLLDQCAVGRSLLIDGDITNHAEHRLQFREPLFRCLRTGKLLVIERHGAVRIFYGDERLIKPTLSNGSCSTRLTNERKIINRIAIDSLKCGNRIRANALLRLRVHGTKV